MTPQQARTAATVLESLGGAHRDVVAKLRELADVQERRLAVWRFDAYTKTLTAGDPGCVRAPRIARVPEFAMHIPSLFMLPGMPLNVTFLPGDASERAAVNAQKYRLAKRLEEMKQPELAAAVGLDIMLEQIGRTVWARYEPVGLPLVLED